MTELALAQTHMLTVTAEVRSNIKDLAQEAIASGLIPGVKTWQQAAIIIQTGLELGFKPMQSLRGIYLIEGKPVLSAALVVAVAKAHPDCVYFRLVSSDAQSAIYETKRKGDPEPTRKTYSMEDAKRAGLTSRPNWQRHPTAMLEARCSSALGRAVFPDALLGVYTEDEAEDIKQSAKEDKSRVIDMPTPARVVEPTEEELYAKYQRVIAAATSIAELKQVGDRLSKEPKQLADALRDSYIARLSELKPKTLQPSDYDKMEEKKAGAREAIEQARANAQHHPPLSVAAAELLKQAGEVNTQGDMAAVVNRKNSIHLTPAESKAIDEALRRRRDALVQAQNSTTPDLLDPKF